MRCLLGAGFVRMLVLVYVVSFFRKNCDKINGEYTVLETVFLNKECSFWQYKTTMELLQA